jgi:hypothetical protein
MSNRLNDTVWEPFRPHIAGQLYSNSNTRFNVVYAGRRSGKTARGKRKMARAAIFGTSYTDSHFFCAAPTRDQAKRIFWREMKTLIHRQFQKSAPSESELVIQTIAGASVHIVGLDKPERIEGSPWDGGLITEMANVKKDAWNANIRPALSDRDGWCDLEGVPEGRNHFFDHAQRARKLHDKYRKLSDWQAHHWYSSDILPEHEILAAKRDLDPLTYQQEYEADFVSFAGSAYYTFAEDTHAKHRLVYSERLPIVLALDFNISPGVAAIGQEQRLPSGEVGTGWIDEVWIESNSTTPKVMDAFLKRYRNHRGQVHVYGDASGGAGGTAKVLGSDWELVLQKLKPVFGPRLKPLYAKSNPAQRARVNAVNSRFRSADGTVKMMVDPIACPHLVRDFGGVDWEGDQLDKHGDHELTHISDAAGYYIERRFPIRAGVVSTGELII